MDGRRFLRPGWALDLYRGVLHPELSYSQHAKILEIFRRYKPEKILDLGCGQGELTALLGQMLMTNELYGVDLSEQAVKQAASRGINAIRADLDQGYIPIRDCSLDAVLAADIMEHLFDPDRFLDEIYRILKPGGLLVISLPNHASIHNRIALLFGCSPLDHNPSHRYDFRPIPGAIRKLLESRIASADHIRCFTYGVAKAILKLHGFQIIRAHGAPGVMPKQLKLWPIRLIDTFISKIPSLSYRVIFECIKPIQPE